MNADQLISDLGLTVGLPGLRFDEHGCARLIFDDKTAVDFERDSDGLRLHVYCVLAQIPADKREALFLMLLEGNLFGTETRGAALAVDSLENDIVLCRSVVAEEVTSAAFTALIEQFVDAAEFWKERIDKTHDLPASAAAADAMPFGALVRG